MARDSLQSNKREPISTMDDFRAQDAHLSNCFFFFSFIAVTSASCLQHTSKIQNKLSKIYSLLPVQPKFQPGGILKQKVMIQGNPNRYPCSTQLSLVVTTTKSQDRAQIQIESCAARVSALRFLQQTGRNSKGVGIK